MEYLLSSIVYLPFNREVDGFLQCKGQILAIKGHEALFSLLGTSYGGDGINNFALPDLRPWQDPPGPDYGHRVRRDWNQGEIVAYICTNGIYPSWP